MCNIEFYFQHIDQSLVVNQSLKTVHITQRINYISTIIRQSQFRIIDLAIYLIMKRNLIVFQRFCTSSMNQTLINDQLYQRLVNFNKNKKQSCFPLNFSQPCKRDFTSKFTQFLIPNIVLKKIQILLEFLQDPVEWRKRNLKQGHNIHFEPTLQNKLFQMITKNELRIEIAKAKPFKVKQVARDEFCGIFIHRKLNMNRKCYSFEIQSKNNRFKFGLREKFTRQSDIQEFNKRRSLFSNDYFYQSIYKTLTFQQFAQKQKIQRIIFRVQTDLQIHYQKISGRSGIRKTTSHQIGFDSPSAHYLQMQMIKIPYSVPQIFLTDVDFLLEGNPYFYN